MCGTPSIPKAPPPPPPAPPPPAAVQIRDPITDPAMANAAAKGAKARTTRARLQVPLGNAGANAKSGLKIGT